MDQHGCDVAQMAKQGTGEQAKRNTRGAYDTPGPDSEVDDVVSIREEMKDLVSRSCWLEPSQWSCHPSTVETWASSLDVCNSREDVYSSA